MWRETLLVAGPTCRCYTQLYVPQASEKTPQPTSDQIFAHVAPWPQLRLACVAQLLLPVWTREMRVTASRQSVTADGGWTTQMSSVANGGFDADCAVPAGRSIQGAGFC